MILSIRQCCKRENKNAGKRLSKLLITHKFHPHEEPEFDIREP
jgi:hypothetical protein